LLSTYFWFKSAQRKEVFDIFLKIAVQTQDKVVIPPACSFQLVGKYFSYIQFYWKIFTDFTLKPLPNGKYSPHPPPSNHLRFQRPTRQLAGIEAGEGSKK
jgi:hypothetical protein